MARWKSWVVASGLLITGASIALLLSGRGTISNTASIIDAWQETFGDPRSTVLEIPVEAIKEGVSATATVPAIKSEASLLARKSAAPKKAVATKPATLKPAASSIVVRTISTPATCDVTRAERPRSGVLINEVAWMGVGGDSQAQWIELKNISGKRNFDLNGWKILDRWGQPVLDFFESKKIGPGGAMVVKRARPLENIYGYKDESEKTPFVGGLERHGDWLKLFDAECVLIDELIALDGWPGGDIEGRTLERKVAERGWQTSTFPGGTPGKDNSVGLITAPPSGSEDDLEEAPVPEPAKNSGAEGPGSIAPLGGSPIIAAVHITGGTGLADNDAVKLYNPGDEPYSLDGWKLRKRTKSGTESSIKTFSEKDLIPAHGYFIWANVKFTAALANTTSTATLSADNSIALFNKENEMVDATAWGSGHISPFIESEAYPENPGAGEWLGFSI